MNYLIAMFLFSTFLVAAPNGSVTKRQEAIKKEKITNEKLKMLNKKEEDCDEKAKKPIEIKPESISLTGNAGCSLEDSH